ncbi:MAG: hypothetical protein ABI634_11335 [Acidobacteriota bacterium]
MRANAFDEFCQAAIDFLATERIPFLLVGGLAVAAQGEPRFTADVDVVAFVTMKAAEGLIARADSAGFGVAADEADRLRATGTLRFHRAPFQLDIIVASLPFEERARQRAIVARLFDREVPLPTPEDLLLFKIISGREKDLLDAVGIARRHRDRIDWPYVAAGVDEVCDLAEQTGPRELLERVRRRGGEAR